MEIFYDYHDLGNLTIEPIWFEGTNSTCIIKTSFFWNLELKLKATRKLNFREIANIFANIFTYNALFAIDLEQV